MTRYVAIAEIRAALSAAPYSCPFHGKDFGFLGTENGQPWGEPRCESCKQPWRVMVALSALDQLDRRVIELQATERAHASLRGKLDRLRAGLDERGYTATGHGTEVDALAAVDTLRESRDEARGELERVRTAATEALGELTDMAMRSPGVWSLCEAIDERLRGALGIVPDPDTTGTVRG